METILVPSKTKKSAGVCDAICKQYTSKEEGSLTATEVRAAQSRLVNRAQVESFGEGIRCLENGQEFISGAESNLLIREWKVDF